MHLQMTKKMLDWIKPTIVDETTDDDVYAWHINYQIINRKKYLVLMHDLSRFSVILYGVSKKDFDSSHHFLYNAIFHALLYQDYDELLIDRYMQGLTKTFTFGKTKNRQIVSWLSRAMEESLCIASSEGLDFNQPEQLHISREVNTFVVGENQFKIVYYPNEKMLACLESLSKN